MPNSEPLSRLYWTKACLGIIAAAICALTRASLFTGIGIGGFIYLLSDRILRQMFIDKVDKPLTVTKTGIGVYILTWVFFWTFFFTLLNPPV